MVELTLYSGTTRMPMQQQITVLMAMVIAILRLTSMPTIEAAVRFCATQRMALPGLVFCR